MRRLTQPSKISELKIIYAALEIEEEYFLGHPRVHRFNSTI